MFSVILTKLKQQQCWHACKEKKANKVILTLTILSEVPPLEMVVPLSPTNEGRVWDIQLVTMAIVLSTAPILSMGTVMFCFCGTRLQSALPCPSLDLTPVNPPSASDSLGRETSQSASDSAWAAADPQERVKHSYQTNTPPAQSEGRAETSWKRAAHIHKHHTESLPSRSDCLSFTPFLPPSTTLSLPLLFLKMQSCAFAASMSNPLPISLRSVFCQPRLGCIYPVFTFLLLFFTDIWLFFYDSHLSVCVCVCDLAETYFRALICSLCYVTCESPGHLSVILFAHILSVLQSHHTACMEEGTETTAWQNVKVVWRAHLWTWTANSARHKECKGTLFSRLGWEGSAILCWKLPHYLHPQP